VLAEDRVEGVAVALVKAVEELAVCHGIGVVNVGTGGCGSPVARRRVCVT
jgi:hypothetical protein